MMRPTDRNGFEIAIICALITESDAFEALFDEFWEEDELEYGKAPGDPNAYTLGRIGRHPIVMTYLPGMGKGSAAAVSASLRISFPNVKLGLIVGICGGVPESIFDNEKISIFLGDVIISTGVIQFDLGRQYDDRVIRKDTLKDNLRRPNPEIRSFLHKNEGWRGRRRLRSKMEGYIAEICGKEEFSSWNCPQPGTDKLYIPEYRHKHHDPEVCEICAKCVDAGTRVCDAVLNLSCDQLGCDQNKLVIRERKSIPNIHFGLIGSCDQVMKSAIRRDRIAHQAKLETGPSSAANISSTPDTGNEDDASRAEDADKGPDEASAPDTTTTAEARATTDLCKAEDTGMPERSRTPDTSKAEDTSSTTETIKHEKTPEHNPTSSAIFNNSAKVGNQAVNQHFAGPVTFTQS
ncbi:hypothetical protein UA08_06085 [Talaromyces atroroseus]|uniref:Nucleoside phosphorylase domain-containing protein n=1 Tax=Talaromyces atroroseus TaxID=1441469 RepID=A0A225AVY0_TALAT|nr:hypothetical protein UA08_06085 [Talaromyces atroroseus]OKL58585.1 hypothetical protein UA08_06085 [Talaromyces atroroseus]